MPSWTAHLRDAQRAVHLTALADRLRTGQAWQAFAELHVYAVFDFMSLLKRLQRDLTCVSVPWVPPLDAASARCINEIVLAEESDEDGAGGYADHFSLYLRAMREAGADTRAIDALVDLLRQKTPWPEAIARAGVPKPAAAFMHHTLTLAESGHAHEVAAAFLFGREALLPQLFAELIGSLSRSAPKLSTLSHYFARHVALDADEHGPLAEQMLERLCGGVAQRKREAEAAALQALEARRQLWEAIGEHVGQA